jgi:hypothetical protein
MDTGATSRSVCALGNACAMAVFRPIMKDGKIYKNELSKPT